MLSLARVAVVAMVPAELVVVVLLVSGVTLPRPLVAAGEVAFSAVLALQLVVAGRLIIAARRAGAGWPVALRSVGGWSPTACAGSWRSTCGGWSAWCCS